jgi:hypothetical protein
MRCAASPGRYSRRGALTYEALEVAVPDPRLLDSKTARDLWFALSYWTDDDDIRDKDANYEPLRRAQIADLLVGMQA